MKNLELHKSIKSALISLYPVRPEGNALRRLNSESMLLAALIRGGRTSFEAMGRELPSNADLESRIKFVKRWVSNKWTDYKVHFLPSVAWLLQRLSRIGELVLAMDGSEVCNGCTALMLSAVWKSRAIPVCWVVRTGSKGHFPEEMHVALLDMASEILPSGCRKVLLGDGEFDGCGLQARCLELGWEYVLRTPKDAILHEDGEEFPFGRLSPAKGQRHFFCPAHTSPPSASAQSTPWRGTVRSTKTRFSWSRAWNCRTSPATTTKSASRLRPCSAT
jgi:hypothetical protein